MDMPMDGKKMGKDSYFKCPNCDAELCATLMDKKEEKSVKKEYSMDELRSKMPESKPMGFQGNLNA